MSELNKDWCRLIGCRPGLIEACNAKCSSYNTIERAVEADRERIMKGISGLLEGWLK